MQAVCFTSISKSSLLLVYSTPRSEVSVSHIFHLFENKKKKEKQWRMEEKKTIKNFLQFAIVFLFNAIKKEDFIPQAFNLLL